MARGLTDRQTNTPDKYSKPSLRPGVNEKAQIEKEKEVKKLDGIQEREEKRLETERRKREKAE